MTHFDPSDFVKRERSENVSPTVASDPPERRAPETEETAVWRAPRRYVAGVAGVAALDPDKPFSRQLNSMFEGPIPPLYMPKRWFGICQDVRKFVDTGKCQAALDAGWLEIELFGFHARAWTLFRPMIPAMGVVFFLDGRGISHVSPSKIEIINRGGSRSNLYRAHHMTHRALCAPMWEALDLRNWPDPYEEEVIFRSN